MCPPAILTPFCFKELLNKWLSVFITETRNKNGDPYPPKTVYNLLCAILREMRTQNPEYPNFLNKQDPAYSRLLNTQDNLYKSLRAAGIGAESCATEGISKEEEHLLWSSGTLNTKTPKGLLRAVFYSCGKCFCLRGGQEHRNLSISQLQRLHDPDRYTYRENASKNKQGGVRQLKMEHKTVTIVANPSVQDRCPVFIIDLYLSKLPSEAKEKNLFYCRPVSNLPQKPDDPWFLAIAVGKNVLGKMVREICDEAGVNGKKTNHSLRVSCATSLYTAGVPEKVIQSRTGHSSLESLKKYERITSDQEEAVAKILTGESSNFESAISSNKEVKDKSSHSSNNQVKDDPSFSSSNETPVHRHGVQYKDCVVNVYQSMPPPMYSPYYFPNYGHLPAAMYAPSQSHGDAEPPSDNEF